MNRQSVLIAAAALSLMVVPLAGAGNAKHRGPYYDFADVLQVKPITESVRVSTPRQQCWQEEVYHPAAQPYSGNQPANRSYTAEILGAIVGAGIGHQFGSGRGQDLATVAGAVLGGSVGRDIKYQNQRYKRHGQHTSGGYTEMVERCETVQDYHSEEVIVGYRVKYSYNGRDYTSRMSRDPGERVRVRVAVSLAD